MNSLFLNLKDRAVSAILIAMVFIISITLLDWLYYIFIILIAIVMLKEWYNMARTSTIFMIVGAILVATSTVSLLLLKYTSHNFSLLLLYFCAIWATDVFAMIGGKWFKGRKLAAYVSPEKTWSGLITGILAAGATSYFISHIPDFSLSNYSYLGGVNLFVLGVVLGAVGQCSDLFISLFKRKFNIKDFSNIIPGHGGVLDRFDSTILTAPLLLCLTKF